MKFLEDIEDFIEVYNNAKLIGMSVEVEYDNIEQKLTLTHEGDCLAQVNNVSSKSAFKVAQQIKPKNIVNEATIFNGDADYTFETLAGNSSGKFDEEKDI